MLKFLMLMSMGLLAPDDGGAGGGGSEDPGNQEPGGQPGNPEPKEPTVGDLQKQLEDERKKSAGKDSTITNLTKETEKVAKLQKQLDELQKAQMSEEERKVAEEQERQEKLSEEHNKFLSDCRVIAAERAGLSEKEAVLISGSTQDEIRENGKQLKALMETQFNAGYEKAKKEGMKGGVPQGGDDPDTKGTSKKLSDLFK